MNAVLQFLDAERNEEEGAESIRRRIRTVISELGFDYFTLVRQPGPENPSSDIMLEGQWPKGWPELYVKRKYATIGPAGPISRPQPARLSLARVGRGFQAGSEPQTHGADDGRCAPFRPGGRICLSRSRTAWPDRSAHGCRPSGRAVTVGDGDDGRAGQEGVLGTSRGARSGRARAVQPAGGDAADPPRNGNARVSGLWHDVERDGRHARSFGAHGRLVHERHPRTNCRPRTGITWWRSPSGWASSLRVSVLVKPVLGTISGPV